MPIFSESLRTDVLTWLETHVPEARRHHILRVEAMARQLAKDHGLDQERAAWAGLLHDLAKCFQPAQLLAMARAEGLPLDPVDQANPHLLHAEVGAIVARDRFGVQDRQVLAAIANHTLGRPGMDALSCVVFLADSLEPGRGESAQLQQLRQLSRRDLVAAVAQTCDESIRHLLDKHRLIHPRTVLTRNWFWQASRQSPPQPSAWLSA